MTTVYALLHWGGWHDEGQGLHGIYSSRERAEAAASTHPPVANADDPLTWGGHTPDFDPAHCWTIVPVEVDVPARDWEYPP